VRGALWFVLLALKPTHRGNFARSALKGQWAAAMLYQCSPPTTTAAIARPRSGLYCRLSTVHRPPSFRVCARRLCSRVLGFPNLTAPNKRLLIRGNGLGINYRIVSRAFAFANIWMPVQYLEYWNSQGYASSYSAPDASTGRCVLSAAARPTALRLYERGSSPTSLPFTFGLFNPAGPPPPSVRCQYLPRRYDPASCEQRRTSSSSLRLQC
jgi:hypothetical protein